MPYTPLEIAGAFIQTGELEDALAVLDEHLENNPDDDRARRLRVGVMMRLPGESYQTAVLRDLEQINNPTADDLVRKSVLHERANALDEAIATMQTALAQQPDDERLAERVVHLLRNNGDLNGARELAASMPQSWRWWQQLGDLAVEAGDHETALTHYSAALADVAASFAVENDWARSFTARLLLARGGTALTLNHYAEAEADYRAADELTDDPMIPFNRGLLAALTGDLTEAVALCGAALSGASETLQAHMETTLRGDARYVSLATLLLQDDLDA